MYIMLYRFARMVYSQCSAVMLPDFLLLIFHCIFIWAGCSFMFMSWLWDVCGCISTHSLGFRVLGIRGRDRVVSELKVWTPWALREVGSGIRLR